jgi:predicted amidophosphoribosyltransferase
MLARMLVPPLCWGCGGVARRREPLCGGCRRLLRRLGPDPVLLCGVPVWAPVAYSGPARDLVRALKFRGATAVADAMAAQIAANAPADLLGAEGAEAALGAANSEAALRAGGTDAALGAGGTDAALGAGGTDAALGAGGTDAALGAGTSPPGAGRAAWRPALVPVPLHPRRLRRRGYNQAALIADALARRAGLEIADCLARTGSAATQVGRGRAERRAGPAGSVDLRAPVPGCAVLVDDVATTGATLAACAAALRVGGSVDVAALVFARTIGR